MTKFHKLFCLFNILVLVLKNHIPETVKETINTIDTTVIPFGIQFRRTYKQFVHSQRITAIVTYQIIRRNDITFGFTHLDTVFTGDHTLVEQFVEWLVKVDHSDIVKEFCVETGIKQMQYRMFYTADIHIYRQIFVCFFSGYKFFVVMRIHVTKEVPGRTCPLRHRVCLTFCRSAALRTGRIYPGINGCQWGFACTCRLIGFNFRQ